MDKLEIIKALLFENESNKNSQKRESIQKKSIKIVVLQRGWVVIGNYSEQGENGILTNAYVIRCWGTSEGLGELALKGKQSETKLEKTGRVKFHKLTSVMKIDCNFEVWEKVLI